MANRIKLRIHGVADPTHDLLLNLRGETLKGLKAWLDRTELEIQQVLDAETKINLTESLSFYRSELARLTPHQTVKKQKHYRNIVTGVHMLSYAVALAQGGMESDEANRRRDRLHQWLGGDQWREDYEDEHDV